MGEGLPANRTLWKKHVRDFEPILDFLHAVEYAYAAAVVMQGKRGKQGKQAQAAWECSLRWAQLCWSGQVQRILPELLAWLKHQGLEPGQTLAEQHPHKSVLEAHRYLTHNASRLNCSRYRQQGLPGCR